MRTTLSLDPDVAARLRRLRESRRGPFKQLVNDALRHGLGALEDAASVPPAGPPTSPVSLGGALLPDVDDVSGVLAVAEGDAR